ncbi:hypothetical protein TIFTF001_022270 [Ficus carica]|uniref:Uncharacterized protein n=1 Tax=Ficus carica TaxID=3494 RepID=A0AA88AIZ8_FICCA|nr:hypothetical protein TIFTF001_022270 [Ficus carica]
MTRFSDKVGLVKKTAEAAARATNREFSTRRGSAAALIVRRGDGDCRGKREKKEERQLRPDPVICCSGEETRMASGSLPARRSRPMHWTKN